VSERVARRAAPHELRIEGGRAVTVAATADIDAAPHELRIDGGRAVTAALTADIDAAPHELRIEGGLRWHRCW
jgi:hypothetical protein